MLEGVTCLRRNTVSCLMHVHNLDAQAPHVLLCKNKLRNWANCKELKVYSTTCWYWQVTWKVCVFRASIVLNLKVHLCSIKMKQIDADINCCDNPPFSALS